MPIVKQFYGEEKTEPYVVLPQILNAKLKSSKLSSTHPPPLDQLLAVYPRGRDNRIFLERIHSYNNAISFASSAISLNNLAVRGVKYLEMHGSVYHLIPPVRDDNGEPIYTQIYMIDGEEAQVARRQDALHRNHGLNVGRFKTSSNSFPSVLLQGYAVIIATAPLSPSKCE